MYNERVHPYNCYLIDVNEYAIMGVTNPKKNPAFAIPSKCLFLY